MLLKFITLVSWIVGIVAAVGFGVCAGGLLLMREARQWEKDATAQTAWWYFMVGILPWSWLITRYFL